jgi:carboxyvinyl-carboxyphosphonate phosphorylmutase
MFLVGVKTREDLEAVAAEIKVPLILGGVPAALMDRTYLASKGVRICLQGHQPFQAAVQAIHDTLKALRDGTAPKDLTGLASAEMMERVTRGEDYARWTREFLGGNV